MTKCYALQKDVFDINKVTVVGSPTITDDGVASGFSSGNYLTAPSLNMTTDSLFDACVQVDCTNATGSGWVFRNKSNATFFCIWTDSRVKNFSFHFANKSITSINVSYDSIYDISFSRININTFHVKIVDVLKNEILKDATYTIEISSITNIDYPIEIGYCTTALDIRIKLNSFKIYVDNELVYSPTKPIYLLERRKEGFDLSKFTVVGTPTITEDGIASGFSAGNYVETTLDSITYNEEFKLCFKANFGADQDAVNAMTYLYATGSSDYIMVYKECRGAVQQLVCAISVNGSTIWQPFVSGLSFNTEYNIELTLKQANYTLSVFDTNGILVNSHTCSALGGTMASLSTALIGKGRSYSAFDGSISLPSISITVDGEEVFTGAKEKFYAMKGGF